MTKVLVAAAVTLENSYAAQQYLSAIGKLEGTFDVLIVDHSATPVYAEWLAKKQKFIRLKVMRKEFPFGTEFLEQRAACHTIIRDYCLEKKYDALLLLEQDVIIAPDGLKLLIAAKRQVISGVCRSFFFINGEMALLPTLSAPYGKEQQKHILEHKDELKENNPKLFAALEKNRWDFSQMNRPLLNDEVAKGNGVIPVKFANFDCLYIAKDVLKGTAFSSEHGTKADDALFFLDLMKRGITVFAHTDVQCSRRMHKEQLEKTMRLLKEGRPASAG